MTVSELIETLQKFPATLRQGLDFLGIETPEWI